MARNIVPGLARFDITTSKKLGVHHPQSHRSAMQGTILLCIVNGEQAECFLHYHFISATLHLDQTSMPCQEAKMLGSGHGLCRAMSSSYVIAGEPFGFNVHLDQHLRSAYNGSTWIVQFDRAASVGAC